MIKSPKLLNLLLASSLLVFGAACGDDDDDDIDITVNNPTADTGDGDPDTGGPEPDTGGPEPDMGGPDPDMGETDGGVAAMLLQGNPVTLKSGDTSIGFGMLGQIETTALPDESAVYATPAATGCTGIDAAQLASPNAEGFNQLGTGQASGLDLNAVKVFATPGNAATVVALGQLGAAPMSDEEASILPLLVGSPDSTVPAAYDETTEALVRGVHAISNFGAVDICAGSVELADGLNYGEVTNWLNVPAGVDLGTAGIYEDDATTCDVRDIANAALTLPVGTLTAGTAITATALGLIAPDTVSICGPTLDAPCDATVEAKVNALADQVAPEDAANFYVGLLHTIPNAPALTICVDADGPSAE